MVYKPDLWLDDSIIMVDSLNEYKSVVNARERHSLRQKGIRASGQQVNVNFNNILLLILMI